MASFQLFNLNPREARHYPKGSKELVRRYSRNSTTQVWIVTPQDIQALKKVLEEAEDG